MAAPVSSAKQLNLSALFTTGLGAPQGFPFVPVIKITGNPITYEHLLEHIDVFIDSAHIQTEQSGQALFDKVLEAASGKPTKAGIAKYGTFPDIFSREPVL